MIPIAIPVQYVSPPQQVVPAIVRICSTGMGPGPVTLVTGRGGCWPVQTQAIVDQPWERTLDQFTSAVGQLAASDNDLAEVWLQRDGRKLALGLVIRSSTCELFEKLLELPSMDDFLSEMDVVYAYSREDLSLPLTSAIRLWPK